MKNIKMRLLIKDQDGKINPHDISHYGDDSIAELVISGEIAANAIADSVVCEMNSTKLDPDGPDMKVEGILYIDETGKEYHEFTDDQIEELANSLTSNIEDDFDTLEPVSFEEMEDPEIETESDVDSEIDADIDDLEDDNFDDEEYE